MSDHAVDDDLSMSIKPTAMHDILSGGLAGMSSIIVGQPFDTVKVRLQTSAHFSSSFDVLRHAVKSKDGLFKSLFAGMTPPLITATAVNAIVFSVYGFSSRHVDRFADDYASYKQPNAPPPTSIYPLNLVPNSMSDALVHRGPAFEFWKNFSCGAFAGLVQCLVICPTEHIKCRLQAQSCPSYQHKLTSKIVHNPFEMSKIVLKEHGLSGLYRGWVSTCLREVPSFGLYFASYDLFRDTLLDRFPSTPNWTSSVVAGAASGAVTWAVVYPVDIIKSIIQTIPLNTPKKERTFMYIARDLVKKHGRMYLFHGLGVTVLRALPVNGMIFPVYELSMYCCCTPFKAWDFSKVF
ncbi:hypothetical protein TL16_g07294 [Triparma laevis f. inornata]|uniref:Uncharacterized protein n=2 Tax=Triparma laevis TaxID=1534972 RepID=A0A9W7F473_9STRA|nr:hypothetical protein TL16_g07294 [Triparma laevis f. inornata]GMI00818.1 hypothetical protein TrLO_g13552 [Triparma laevis f. longispina]